MDVGLQSESMARVGLPRAAFESMLRKLRSWIEALNPADTGKTVWQDYAGENSYSDEEAIAKRRFVAEFAAATTPKLVWDFGCNSGDYSVAALEAGARYAVGFDFDQGALERGYARANADRQPTAPTTTASRKP